MNEDTCQFQVTEMFYMRNLGVVACGRVIKGIISVGDTLECNIPGESSSLVKCRALEKQRKVCNTANTGDEIGILLGEVEFSWLQARMKPEGIFLNTPETARFSNKFTAECLFTEEKGIADLQEKGKIRVMCRLFNRRWLCEVSFSQKDTVPLEINKEVSCEITLIYALQIHSEMKFELCDGKECLATGSITDVMYL